LKKVKTQIMEHLDVNGKKVLVRVDFNVPLDKQFQVTDDTRIRGALPTIEWLLDRGAAVIVMSHLGRPWKKLREDGTLDAEKHSLRHVVPVLEHLLERKVHFVPHDCVGPEAEAAAAALLPGEVLLLENTRFHKGEEKGDEELALRMSKLADIFVNDAFGAAHRAHSSTTIIARHFPKSRKAFGFLMQAELDNAHKVIDHPARPFTAIIGGAKVSDKILLLEKLLDQVDNLLIGGGMAYTFFRARGFNTGNSLVEEDRLDLARQIIEKARQRNINLLLPADSVVADRFANDARFHPQSNDRIASGWMGLDIGPLACGEFATIIEHSRTILWNGPMGVFEMPNFATGTKVIAQAVAKATAKGAFSLIGGGDSVAAINQLGLGGDVSYVSTGGGALLELFEGKELPGVKAILE
jgi:phosphoglycerate kinase